MGAIKKLFGGGSSMPQVQQVAPAVQSVQSVETSADTNNAGKKKNRNSGFASTQAAPVLTNAGEEKKTTLG